MRPGGLEGSDHLPREVGWGGLGGETGWVVSTASFPAGPENRAKGTVFRPPLQMRKQLYIGPPSTSVCHSKPCHHLHLTPAERAAQRGRGPEPRPHSRVLDAPDCLRASDEAPWEHEDAWGLAENSGGSSPFPAWVQAVSARKSGEPGPRFRFMTFAGQWGPGGCSTEPEAKRGTQALERPHGARHGGAGGRDVGRVHVGARGGTWAADAGLERWGSLVGDMEG